MQEKTRKLMLQDFKDSEGIKVLFLYLGNAAGSWYRMLQYAYEFVDMDGIYPIFPKFDPAKCDKELRDYEMNPTEWITDLNKLFVMADVVICSTAHNPEFIALLLSMRQIHNIPFIVECDDNLFSIHSEHQGYRYIGADSTLEYTVYQQIKNADVVIASTEYLRKSIMKYNGNITVIPNGLDYTKWENLEKPDNGENFVIGWAGAANHERDIALVEKAIYYLLDKYPNLYFKTLHGAPGAIHHPRFSCDESWTSIDKYPAKLASMGFDVALAPLWDSEFNRCKSNLRYLEYSMLKIPTIASEVEPYAKTIQEGVDGFFFDNPKILVDKIELLMLNANVRKTIAENALKKVGFPDSPFSTKTIAFRYADFLRNFYKEWCEKNVQLSGNSEQDSKLLRG